MTVETYLETAMQTKIKTENWASQTPLPPFLKWNRRFTIMYVGDDRMLLVEDRQQRVDIQDIIRDNRLLEQRSGMQPVFSLQGISVRQANTLRSQGISFVIPKSQIYIPQLGQLVAGRYRSLKRSRLLREIDLPQMPAGTQLIWLYLFYTGGGITQTVISKATGIAKSNVSTAISYLEAAQLVTKESAKRNASIIRLASEDRRKLLDDSWELMRSPVLWSRTAILDEDAQLPLLESGETALAKRTILGYTDIDSYALNHLLIKPNKDAFTFFIDGEDNPPDGAIRLESWRYNPLPLTSAYGQEPDMADPVSVALSLRGTYDDRVEKCMKESLRKVVAR